MRKISNFNENWIFTKEMPEDFSAIPQGDKVNLPHTWNAVDGQDGGNDYYRGECYYFKPLCRDNFEGEELWLEFLGANSSARVFVNGNCAGTHNGGYSTFRVNITPFLEKENIIAVAVDNSPNDNVYPQMADFTFYGGLYRDVRVISVPACHFDLSYVGAPGIAVTPKILGKSAEVEIDVYLDEAKDKNLLFEILDGENNTVASETVEAVLKKAVLTLENVHLWDGVFDPYLYKARVTLFDKNQCYDTVETRFGCRTFEVSAKNGFMLNGREYALRGVSRHQDRWGLGNALKPEHHREDMELINELGANTIRLAHYQHDQFFYDLCDEYGMVIWAEIPYISNHLSAGLDNTVSQMKELVVQNYNHPSIFFWGLSNEITMGGSDKEELLENHRILNDLVHTLDHTRYTTVAVLSMCSVHDAYLKIPDLIAYNHYFGWYGGDTSMNGEWFDKFHREYPLRPIAVSEYGAEGLNWHTSKPVQGDYTEEYQAHYHEELIKQLFSRKYIWATYVWNMFDFGADARAEGGENGQNHKGLVTFDRKYKKDSFYAYKAHLSSVPFVHIAGKRYVDRVEDVTEVTVYSNLDTVELFANGKSLGKKKAPHRFFKFEVPNVGETELEAVAGSCRDNAKIRKVDTFNEEYTLKEKGAILNWFDITEPEGCLSLNDKVDVIMASHDGARVMAEFFSKIQDAMPVKPHGMGPEMMKMLGSFTLLRLTSLVSMLDVSFTKDELLTLNRRLNRIRKPEEAK
ncbi:MAG: glycoside hydrolase family 2 protein [Clostridia bacterium]|nr:glycoside hydrolase family 2 protein [Clostridia bacterium]